MVNPSGRNLENTRPSSSSWKAYPAHNTYLPRRLQLLDKKRYKAIVFAFLFVAWEAIAVPTVYYLEEVKGNEHLERFAKVCGVVILLAVLVTLAFGCYFWLAYWPELIIGSEYEPWRVRDGTAAPRGARRLRRRPVMVTPVGKRNPFALAYVAVHDRIPQRHIES